MRARLLAVYLLLQTALGLIVAHAALPLLLDNRPYCDDMVDVETGERTRECFYSESAELRRADLSGTAGLLVGASALALFLLAPVSVLELAEVSRYRAWRPISAKIVGTILVLVPLTINWDAAGAARLSVIAVCAGALTIFAGARWPKPLPTRDAAAPPTNPIALAPAEGGGPIP